MMIWILLALQQMPDNSEAMKKLEWLQGAWSGTGEMKGAGPYTNEILFDWTLNRNFLKVVQTVRTADMVIWHSTGLLGWDCKKKQFAWFQFGFDGTIGWTRTADDKVADLIVLEGGLSDAGPFKSFRNTFKKTGKDTLSETIEFKEGEALTPFISTEFKRLEKAPEAKPVEAPDAGNLKRFEWMIGTWIGGGEMQGQKYEDEYVLEWDHSGNFIKNSYWMRVDGKVMWHDTGMIGWDAEKKKFVGVNFGFDGTIGWGEGDDPGDAAALSWEGETFGPSENIKFRATLKKVDDDTMMMACEKKDGDQWVSYMPDQTRKRKK